MNNSFVFFAAGVYVAISLVVIGLTFTPRYQGWAATRLARSVALILTPEVEAMVRRRVVQQSRGTTLGGLAGMLIGLAVVSADPQLVEQPFGGYLWVGLIFAGNAVGASVTAAISVAQLPNDSVRYARAHAVELRDYISPLERHGARIVVGLAVMMLFLSAILNTSGLVRFTSPLPLTAGIILALLSIIALALFEIEGHWLMQRGQPAGSAAELSWDDALRSEFLRNLVVSPFGLAAYSLILSSLGLADAANRGNISLAMNIGGNVFGYGSLVLLLLVVASRPQRYFRLRLWPDLAEGL